MSNTPYPGYGYSSDTSDFCCSCCGFTFMIVSLLLYALAFAPRVFVLLLVVLFITALVVIYADRKK